MRFELDLGDDYSLIGIHTSEEDYRLAFLLNQHLKTNFTNSKNQLDFKNDVASFSVFEFINEQHQLTIHLIANKFVGNARQSTELNLFNSEVQFSNISYLIPEKKNIDYFVKIEGDITNNELNKRIDTINKINQVITSYQINPAELKSKDYLIF